MERRQEYNADPPISIEEKRETFVREDGSTYTREDIYVKLAVTFRDRMLAELKGPPLSVYLCIALHCGGSEMTAYPSIATIVKETGYSRTAVITAIKKLERMGLVVVSRRDTDNGDSDNNHYKVRGYVTMGRGSTPSVPPVVNQVYHGSTPGVPKEETIEEETKQETAVSGQEQRRPDMWDLARKTEKARKRQKVYTVTESASGANPYADGPLKAACTVCHMLPEALTPRQQRQWCQWLGELAEECAATVDELTEGILKIPEEDSGCRWDYDHRKYRDPKQYKFRHDVTAQIARMRSAFEEPEPQPQVIRFAAPTYLGVTS